MKKKVSWSTFNVTYCGMVIAFPQASAKASKWAFTFISGDWNQATLQQSHAIKNCGEFSTPLIWSVSPSVRWSNFNFMGIFKPFGLTVPGQIPKCQMPKCSALGLAVPQVRYLLNPIPSFIRNSAESNHALEFCIRLARILRQELQNRIHSYQSHVGLGNDSDRMS